MKKKKYFHFIHFAAHSKKTVPKKKEEMLKIFPKQRNKKKEENYLTFRPFQRRQPLKKKEPKE